MNYMKMSGKIPQDNSIFRWYIVCILLIISTLKVYCQSLLNVEGDKILFLGSNLLDTCSISFNPDCWTYENGDLKRKTSNDLTPFVFQVSTRNNSDYYFHVIQKEGKLTNAFHVGIGGLSPTDPYNLTTEMAVLMRADCGYLKIYPQSGESFVLSDIRFSEISDTITSDSVSLMQNSVAIGMPQSSVGGKWNVAIGDSTTMANNLNATRSIAIGHNALSNMESGIQNIGIGTFSLYEMQYGERNIGLGPDALYRTRNAFDNVAIGRGVLANEKYSQQEALLERNVAIGNFAMIRNSESTHDAVAIGYCANADCGDEDVAIGNHANERGGAKNVVIGFEAAKLNGRDENVIIGYKAVPGDTGKGKGNVIIGAYSDIEGPVNNSVVIGKDASISFADNSIAIGANSVCSKANQTSIGNTSTSETVIHGDLIVRGSDGKYRRVVFLENGNCTWTLAEEYEPTTALPSNEKSENMHLSSGIYDLSGKAIKNIRVEGFYIINGEKVYVRPE